MKKFLSLFLIGMTILFSISCSNSFYNKSSDTSISITLPFQAREVWLKSDVTKYKIILTPEADKDNPKTQTATPERPTVTFQELEPGTYLINVFAYNEETEIAAGQTKVTVEEGQSATANVRMTLYQTKGGNTNTVTVTLNSNYENGPAPVQWKGVNPEIETMMLAYNTLINDTTFNYGERTDVMNNTTKYLCGWSVGKPVENPDEATTILQTGDKYQFTEDVTLYAVWCNSNTFFKDTGNFEIDYELPGYETYKVYYLDSHRDNITIPRFKHLFPNITFPEGTLYKQWKTSEEESIFEGPSEGKTYSNIEIENEFNFYYYFDVYAATFYANGIGSSGFVTKEITEYSDFNNNIEYYILPEGWKDFGKLKAPENYKFKYWSNTSTGENQITKILYADFPPSVYAIWEESPYLSQDFEILYPLTNNEISEDNEGNIPFSFDFVQTGNVAGKITFAYNYPSNPYKIKLTQTSESGVYTITLDSTKTYDNPFSENDVITIDYVTDNGTICTFKGNKYYLATQADYDNAINTSLLTKKCKNPENIYVIDSNF